MRIKTTHTLAELTVPAAFFDYVEKALREAGYGQAILTDARGGGTMLDMSGIGLLREVATPEDLRRKFSPGGVE